MKKVKYIILLILIIIAVGYAAITSSLGLGAKTYIASDIDDFKVYFSKVLIDGVENENVISNSTTINYIRTLTNIGESYTITYEITNASKSFDATVYVNCVTGDEYLSTTNSFDNSNLPARTTRTGELTVKKIKSNSTNEEKNYSVSCNITTRALSRDEQAKNEVPEALEGYKYAIGKEITIDTEKFNIISETDTTVTMFAQHNLGTDYKQTTEKNSLNFSNVKGWEYTPGPKDINIELYDGNIKNYLTNYTSYIQDLTQDVTITSNLISLQELKSLGCTISDTYSDDVTNSCMYSIYKTWLLNDQDWWTRSAYSGRDDYIWVGSIGGGLYNRSYGSVYGIRPTITISKETLENYL